MLEDILTKYGADEVSAMDVYGDVFDLGYGFIQRIGEESGMHKANPIVLGSFEGVIRRRILYEDVFEETLKEFQTGASWAILNGLTYWGRRNTGSAQSKMCAMVFDLDGQTDGTLNAFLHGASGSGGFQLYPLPQYVILSGSNVHLYYVFEEPIDLYPNTKVQLKDLKYQLTDKIWNRYTSVVEKPQHQGINQGFRVIGGKTKDGGTVRAFHMNRHPCTLEELNGFVPEDKRVDVSKIYRESKYTIDQAKERFPEWYESVVVRGEPRVWYDKQDLYSWWLRKISTPYIKEGNIGGRHVGNAGVTYGHRYFCIMALAIFAVKCGITDRDRVKADAMGILDLFNCIGPEPFLESDIDSALECLDLKYIRFPRKDLEKITAVEMPPNKRNGRRQEQHMAVMRAIQDVTDPLGTWRNKDGAPRKRDAVRAYAEEHPDANHSQIAKALGVSRTTVVKWLKNSEMSSAGSGEKAAAQKTKGRAAEIDEISAEMEKMQREFSAKKAALESRKNELSEGRK